ncbi:Flagellar hook-associated protein 2 [compost metagenome]
MFQIGGMASGLDTSTMVEQLMLLERKPIAALQQRKTAITQKDSAFQALNTRLSALKNKLADLTLERNLKPKKATTSAEATLTATAGSGAAEGTYRIKVNQLATATTVGSSVGLGTAVDVGSLKLSELKPFNSTAITAGTFTVGGATLTINSTDATLDEVVAALNGNSSANVSVAGSTGLGGAAASLTPEGQIRLDVGLKPDVAIGSGADTSNFLTVAGLKSPSSVGDFRTGARMNVLQLTRPLNNTGANGANLATPVTGDVDGKGSFKINGVEISYNANTDAMKDILNRINSSTAGVVASYNSIEDRIVLTNKTTGNAAIGLEDVTGNFLSAVKLLGTSQQTGHNASITIDGIAGNLESSTNEFKDAVPGVIFTAKEVKTSEWTTITVTSDTDATVNAIKGFIQEFNATVDAIEAARGKGKPLQGDSTLSSIMSKLYRLVYEPVEGLSGAYSTLSSIGIGTTTADRKHLSLDETKFKDALASNPDRVAELFNREAAADKPTGVAGRLKAFLGEVGGAEGVFATRKDSAARQTKYIDDQIASYEIRLEQRRKTLVSQFTAMEKAVGLMKSQQSALMSQLASLQGS